MKPIGMHEIHAGCAYVLKQVEIRPVVRKLVQLAQHAKALFYAAKRLMSFDSAF
jgi:hypothetical protein